VFKLLPLLLCCGGCQRPSPGVGQPGAGAGRQGVWQGVWHWRRRQAGLASLAQCSLLPACLPSKQRATGAAADESAVTSGAPGRDEPAALPATEQQAPSPRFLQQRGSRARGVHTHTHLNPAAQSVGPHPLSNEMSVLEAALIPTRLGSAATHPPSKSQRLLVAASGCSLCRTLRCAAMPGV
jgi:hypothetical protein